MPLYAQYHVPNLWSIHVQGRVGLIQMYLIYVSILSELTLLKLVSYLILEIKGGLSFVSYLRYFFKLSSPTLIFYICGGWLRR